MEGRHPEWEDEKSFVENLKPTRCNPEILVQIHPLKYLSDAHMLHIWKVTREDFAAVESYGVSTAAY